MVDSVYYSFHDIVVFFFKQKTAYEMRISDWSSDVCSSDLVAVLLVMGQLHPVGTGAHAFGSRHPLGPMPLAVTIGQGIERCGIADTQIGRASCRARVCQYV